MSKKGIRVGAVLLASAAMLGAGGARRGGRHPCPPRRTTLSGIQSKAAAAVSLRANDLNAAMSKVNADSRLGSDAAALAAYLQADIAPLQALGQKIAGDTTESTAAADYATIFTNYRVLALVLPAAHIAGAADRSTSQPSPRSPRWPQRPRHTSPVQSGAGLQPLIDDLNAQIAAATTVHHRRFRHRVRPTRRPVERQPRPLRFGPRLGSVRPAATSPRQMRT